jgi:hypothetical protein
MQHQPVCDKEHHLYFGIILLQYSIIAINFFLQFDRDFVPTISNWIYFLDMSWKISINMSILKALPGFWFLVCMYHVPCTMYQYTCAPAALATGIFYSQVTNLMYKYISIWQLTVLFDMSLINIGASAAPKIK